MKRADHVNRIHYVCSSGSQIFCNLCYRTCRKARNAGWCDSYSEKKNSPSIWCHRPHPTVGRLPETCRSITPQSQQGMWFLSCKYTIIPECAWVTAFCLKWREFKGMSLIEKAKLVARLGRVLSGGWEMPCKWSSGNIFLPWAESFDALRALSPACSTAEGNPTLVTSVDIQAFT